MPHFKDAQNKLYFLDAADVAEWKKPDWLPVTDAEAETIRNPPPNAEQLREQAKAARAQQVAAITVTTTAGRTFDGDEISQDRMARAILGLNASGPAATVNWVLANNTVIQATAAELTEALAKAGAAQAAIWVIP